MSDVEIDFEYIKEIASNVKNVYDNDENSTDWVEDVINEYNESLEFREGLLDEIVDYLYSFNDDEYKNLAEKVIEIRNADGDDNILSSIFFAEDEVEPQTTGTATIVGFDDDDDDREIDESNPQQFFDRKINLLKKDFQISYDLAYLLLKKFNFSKDKIQQDWFNSQESLLKSLHITIGGQNVPSLNSPLAFRNLGKGECPICCEERDIYELYCGHQLCDDCLFKEFKINIDKIIPCVCPCNCSAEIMPHDVKKILEGHPDLIERYETAIQKSEISCDNEVRSCDICDALITPSHKFSYSFFFGRCAHCNFATCLRCKKGYHGPLTCSRYTDFFDERKNAMQQLEDDQESWYLRERRLQAYRREHKEPVFKYFDQRLAEVKNNNRKAEAEENCKLAENKTFIDKKNKELNALRAKERSLLNSKDTNKINEIENEITKLTQLIENKKYIDKMARSTFERNQKDRQKELLDADTEKELLINAISNETKFDFFLDEYKTLVNTEAYQSLNVSLSNEETIKRSTKLCPKCGVPIEKSYGCNYMKCICHFEFCYFCNEPWLPNHSDHHKCPKYDLMASKKKTGKSSCGIDFNDMKDMKFYPPPMTADKRKDYIRYSNLSIQYMNFKEKLEKIEDELRPTSLQDPKKSISDYNYKDLTPKNRLIKCLMSENSQSSATNLANMIINTIVFGLKTVMYGFPQMYYIMLLKGDFNVFEYHLYTIDKYVDQLMYLIREPGNSKFTQFQQLCNLIDSEARIVLEEGEKF